MDTEETSCYFAAVFSQLSDTDSYVLDSLSQDSHQDLKKTRPVFIEAFSNCPPVSSHYSHRKQKLNKEDEATTLLCISHEKFT